MTTTNNNGLLLYLHNYSFYVQRVVMALHEKKLNYKSQTVDLTKGEQYQLWFLDINPRGEVPVLRDGDKIIPDSNRIIDYLEDNLSNGDTPRLIPLDEGTEVKQKVVYWRELIDTVPANVVTVGCCYHPDLITKPRLPFIAPVRAVMKVADGKAAEKLKNLADKYPQYREKLLSKASAQEKTHEIVSNRENFCKLLGDVDATLAQVEQQLNTVDDEDWLVTKRFTVADVNLAVLLERLSQVGLEAHLWANKPRVAAYYRRVRARDSFRKTIPGAWFHLKALVGGKAAAVGVVAVAASVAGAVYFSRKSD